MILEPVAWWQAYAEWYAAPRPWSEFAAMIGRSLQAIGEAYRAMMPTMKEATERILAVMASR